MINKRILIGALIILAAFALLLSAQSVKKEGKKQLPPDLQDRVNLAIMSATQYLTANLLQYAPESGQRIPGNELIDYNKFQHSMRFADLILYTLAHCNVKSKEDWNTFIDRVTRMKLDKTYHVALQAMALQHIDPIKYQQRLADCGQYLIDNQCKNGQWAYGSEKGSPRWSKSLAAKDKVVTTGGDGKSPAAGDETRKASDAGTHGTTSMPEIKLSGGPEGPPKGDNSNTQYAILGIRACLESNIGPFNNALALAKKWIQSCQNKDGSWGYCGNGFMPSQGYGSMTMGMAGSLCIAKYYLKELNQDVTQEPWFSNTLKWIQKNYTVSENPLAPSKIEQQWGYYYLYALERMGVLSEQETLAGHDWYQDGAKYLVDKQGEDGSWNNTVCDTCFALLFLTRSTKPLKVVVTGPH